MTASNLIHKNIRQIFKLLKIQLAVYEIEFLHLECVQEIFLNLGILTNLVEKKMNIFVSGIAVGCFLLLRIKRYGNVRCEENRMKREEQEEKTFFFL